MSTEREKLLMQSLKWAGKIQTHETWNKLALFQLVTLIIKVARLSNFPEYNQEKKKKHVIVNQLASWLFFLFFYYTFVQNGTGHKKSCNFNMTVCRLLVKPKPFVPRSLAPLFSLWNQHIQKSSGFYVPADNIWHMVDCFSVLELTQ